MLRLKPCKAGGDPASYLGSKLKLEQEEGLTEALTGLFVFKE